MICTILILFFGFSSVQSLAYYGVDIRDLAKYSESSDLANKASLVDKYLLKDVRYIYGQHIQYLPEGVGFDPITRKSSVFSTAVEGLVESGDRTWKIKLISLVHDEYYGYFFQRFTLNFDEEELSSFTVDQYIALKYTKLFFEVDLLDRKLIVRGNRGIRLVYPMGVGGFDMGIQNSASAVVNKTPLFQGTTLSRPYIMHQRRDPEYYQGRPFIRVMYGKNNWTAYGIHYQITPDFVRGFVSNGCLRLRDKDLYELEALVEHGLYKYPGFKVSLITDAPYDHPFPHYDESYKTVKKFGGEYDENGVWIPVRAERDPESNLTIMEWEEGAAPLDQIGNFVEYRPID